MVREKGFSTKCRNSTNKFVSDPLECFCIRQGLGQLFPRHGDSQAFGLNPRTTKDKTLNLAPLARLGYPRNKRPHAYRY